MIAIVRGLLTEVFAILPVEFLNFQSTAREQSFKFWILDFGFWIGFAKKVLRSLLNLFANENVSVKNRAG